MNFTQRLKFNWKKTTNLTKNFEIENEWHSLCACLNIWNWIFCFFHLCVCFFLCRLSKAIRLIIFKHKITTYTHKTQMVWHILVQSWSIFHIFQQSGCFDWAYQTSPPNVPIRPIHSPFYVFFILGCGFYWIYLFFNQFPWIWIGNIWYRREIHSKLNSIEFVLKRCKLIKLSFILIVVIWGFNSN